MEGSIAPDLLSLALGDSALLPTAEELSDMLATAELSLLLQEGSVPEDLLAMGWYLHGIASSKFAFESYGIERHRAAFRVSAHIFDLCLQQNDISDLEHLKFCFASQIGYLRSTLDPNALALYRREFPNGCDDYSIFPDFQYVSLACGVSFLGFGTGYLYSLTDRIAQQRESTEAEWGISLNSTFYGASIAVAAASRLLISYLNYGGEGLIEQAKQILRSCLTDEAFLEDDISRWVAAHLLNICDDLKNSSIWTVLPPNVPPIVRKAFVRGYPQILTLWPPQINLLNAGDEQNSLLSDAKRSFISSPTSAGKTLIAQIMVATHLANNTTSVCYVAPTRSLCREVHQDLQARLRFMNKTIVSGIAETENLSLFDFTLIPEVEIMTPERLSYLLRFDSDAVINRFGLFLFDEVHMIGEQKRGWILEQCLTIIHNYTKELANRIVLLSAVIGNRHHFVDWISLDNPPLTFHGDWRGPRRITSLWSTDPNWDEATNSYNNRAKSRKYYREVPLHGRLTIQTSHDGAFKSLTTSEVGKLTLRSRSGEFRTENEEDEKDTEKVSNRSTPTYQMLVPIISYLGNFGSVLIIEATKLATIRLASALAEQESLITTESIAQLTNLIQYSLGKDHPLPDLVKKGIAYHHGSLPLSIRGAIQDAVSKGDIKYIVATTTLTEGINLPVSSVVIASQGTYTGNGDYEEYITGSKLLNAIGRAGRATKETEGIVVLAVQEPSAEEFAKMKPTDDDLHIRSMLVHEVALTELVNAESQIRKREDSLFEIEAKEISDFLQFVWFVLSELDKRELPIIIQRFREIIADSFGWVQLEEEQKTHWLTISEFVLNQYLQTDTNSRKRWATSGTSLKSSRVLETLAHEFSGWLRELETEVSPIEVIISMLGGDRLSSVLELAEAPTKTIYNRRSRGRIALAIPTLNLLTDWLQGMSLPDMATKYLGEVPDIAFRYEQLGDYLNEYFETYLPWVAGIIANWANDILAEAGEDVAFIPAHLPSYIKYGVSTPSSLELMMRGLQSRTLAMIISRKYEEIDPSTSILDWLCSLSMSQWQGLFQASLPQMQDLLSVVQSKRTSIVGRLLNSDTVVIEVGNTNIFLERQIPEFRKTPDDDFSHIEIFASEQHIGTVDSYLCTEINHLLNNEYQMESFIYSEDGNVFLELKLVEPYSTA